MLYFRGPEAASQWLAGKEGVHALPVADAFRLAQEAFIKPFLAE